MWLRLRFSMLERAEPGPGSLPIVADRRRPGGLPLNRVHALVETVCNVLLEDGRISLGWIRSSARVDAADVVNDALKTFGSYHSSPVLERRGDRIFAGDMNLLFFYHNRLDG